MTIISSLGILAGICTSCSFFPQAIKTIKTKDTKAISFSMYFIYTIGVLLWIIYGFLQKDVAVLLTNAVAFFPSAAILVITADQQSKGIRR